MRSIITVACATTLQIAFCSVLRAQETCRNGFNVLVAVQDQTGASIRSALVVIDEKTVLSVGADGRYLASCLHQGTHRLKVSANSFADREVNCSVSRNLDLKIMLFLGTVETTVNVGEENAALIESSVTSTGPTQTISGTQLESLADDPDDLLRELQQLSAAGGGAPASATIAVDGFEGSETGAKLPPKSSIVSIKIDPDLFSSEYRNPPLSGGRIEVTTKAGQKAFHGAVFMTNSSPWMNARDPFSTANVSLGKQRYGFDLTGPLHGRTSDFLLSLEHRDIADDAVVNAITLNSAGIQTPVLQTVTAPQHLWNGLAKMSWQIGSQNTFIASFSETNGARSNFGVGGSALQETGTDRTDYDQDLRLLLTTIVSSNIVHEARLEFERDGQIYKPNSTAPSVSVAGAFTAGGSTIGAGKDRLRWSNLDDDAIVQAKNHLLKIGLQMTIGGFHDYSQTNFNGVYTFGGVTTSSGQTITGAQQYVNALNGNPNGSPTTFSDTSGSPFVTTSHMNLALYVQDDWHLRPNVHVALGLRYYAQINPSFPAEVQPRLGISWSPDKKSSWELHAHVGMFAQRFGIHSWEEIKFANGKDRNLNTVYSPVCAGPFDPYVCQPVSSGALLRAVRTVAPNLPDAYWSAENAGFNKKIGRGLSITSDYYLWQMWHMFRSVNINPPADGQPTGPRPFVPNLNILQLQASGRGYGNVEFVSVTERTNYLQLYSGAVRSDLIDDTNNDVFFSPMTTGVNTGEYARRDSQGLWQVFGNATANLPWKLQLSAIYNANGMQPYNVTTGFDNNGDGNFNDRPQYAPTGTPLCNASPGTSPCGYQTPWGELVNSGGTRFLSRNKGTMPWTFYVDTNLQRTFALVKNRTAEHQQTLLINIRSSNILNHQNVTAVGSVLGSPQFGLPYAAASGRRIEFGVRYSF